MSEEYTSEALKEQVLSALMGALKGEDPQASMVAQAINFLKVFPPDRGDFMQTGELSGSLKKYADKFQHAPLQ